MRKIELGYLWTEDMATNYFSDDLPTGKYMVTFENGLPGSTMLA